MQASISKNEFVVNSAFVEKILEAINGATENISALMFDWRWYKNDFSCDVSLINQALVRAVRRGVRVRVIVNYSLLVEQFLNVGFEVKHWKADKMMHAKMFVIDGGLVVVGSHNLTENAMHRNLEVSVFCSDSELTKQASLFFDSLWQS